MEKARALEKIFLMLKADKLQGIDDLELLPSGKLFLVDNNITFHAEAMLDLELDRVQFDTSMDVQAAVLTMLHHITTSLV